MSAEAQQEKRRKAERMGSLVTFGVYESTSDRWAKYLVVVSGKSSLFSLAKCLCDNSLEKLGRTDDDGGNEVYEHMWHFEVRGGRRFPESADSKLLPLSLLIAIDGPVHFVYDYGSTTTLVLRKIREVAQEEARAGESFLEPRFESVDVDAACFAVAKADVTAQQQGYAA